MATKMTLDATRGMAVEKTGAKLNPDGSIAVTGWDVKPGQIEKHLRGISDPAHPFNALAPGDKSAAADFANEVTKQRQS